MTGPHVSKPEILKKIDSVPWGKKRPALAAILKPLVDATSGKHPPLAGPFGTISVNSQRCSGCGACLDACHTDALKADEKSMALKTCEILCVACGLCEAVCPESAISVQAGLRWNSEVFRYRTAARVQGIACKNCGKVFGTRQAVETVIERLADRINQQTRQLLMLCPDCRVVMALTEGKF
jgi:ferredoxin